jgi:hypothetical protein
MIPTPSARSLRHRRQVVRTLLTAMLGVLVTLLVASVVTTRRPRLEEWRADCPAAASPRRA